MSAIDFGQLSLGFSGEIADYPPQQRSADLQSHFFVSWKRVSSKKDSSGRSLAQRLSSQQRLEIGCNQRRFLQFLGGGADCLGSQSELEHGYWIQWTSRWSSVASC